MIFSQVSSESSLEENTISSTDNLKVVEIFWVRWNKENREVHHHFIFNHFETLLGQVDFEYTDCVLLISTP